MYINNREPIAFKSGTTTVGLVCKDGVIVAADRKVSAGNIVAHKIGRKILVVDKYALATIAGVVADAQAVVDMIKANVSLYRIRNKRYMSIKTIATLASNILFSSRIFPYIIDLTIAGVDQTGPHLYSIDPFGSVTEEKYIARGSGSPMALGLLEKEYTPDLKVDEGVKIVALAVKSAMRWDPFSGEGIDVAVVDDKGYRFIDEEYVKKTVGEL